MRGITVGYRAAARTGQPAPPKTHSHPVQRLARDEPLQGLDAERELAQRQRPLPADLAGAQPGLQGANTRLSSLTKWTRLQ